MPLTLYRRHTKACVQKRQKAGDRRSRFAIESDRSWRRCNCPIQAEGTLRLDGFIRYSTGETTWDKAEEWKAEAEHRGTLKIAPAPEDPTGPKRIEEAIADFKEDAKARHLSSETLKKYRALFDQLEDFSRKHGLTFMPELDVPALRKFRATWADKGISATKKRERLCSFFNFCANPGWVPLVTPTRNGMRSAAHAVQKPKEESVPTMPYTPEMMTRIFAAIDRMPTLQDRDRDLELKRFKCQIFMMRYAGLAIIDAATLSIDRILDGNRLLLYRAKTGVPVAFTLPDFVIKPLMELPLYRGKYFFWNRTKENSKPASATGNLRRRLRKLLKLAGVTKPSNWAISHSFRDTFAVEFLNNGGTMEELQILLGHKSIETTQMHYAPFDPRRARKLDESLARMFAAESRPTHVN
jgi:integrase